MLKTKKAMWQHHRERSKSSIKIRGITNTVKINIFECMYLLFHIISLINSLIKSNIYISKHH